MLDAFVRSLSLVGASGQVIIGAIFLLLALGVTINLAVRARYRLLDRDLRRHGPARQGFSHTLLNRIVDEARAAQARSSRDINTQAIIEHNFQRDLGGSLLGERFVKSTTGLMIILGLVGTFYGLTLSITKLVALVSGDVAGSADVAQSLTTGLTQALGGMSVAFTVSLYGISSAIIMTLVGVFSNLGERRTALMVRVEDYIDNQLFANDDGDEWTAGHAAGSAELARQAGSFGRSVAQLDAVVTRFESALQAFATTTRDFREFNLHLKDNVQRMSLSFGDLADRLRERER